MVVHGIGNGHNTDILYNFLDEQRTVQTYSPSTMTSILKRAQY